MNGETESGQCENCGYVGEFEEKENPEHLWGAVGETSYFCPECGAWQNEI